MSSMKKGIMMALAALSMGAELSAQAPVRKVRNVAKMAPYVFSYSAGHYKGAAFNRISRRRTRNKIARKSRRINQG